MLKKDNLVFLSEESVSRIKQVLTKAKAPVKDIRIFTEFIEFSDILDDRYMKYAPDKSIIRMFKCFIAGTQQNAEKKPIIQKVKK